MLDVKSKLVLKVLIKECGNGSYKIIEGSDIISALPPRYRVDSDGLDNILNFLERQDCISIKYDDDGVYCLCILPYGFQTCENEGVKKGKERKNSFPSFWVVFFSSLFACIGAIIGSFIGKLF